MDESVQRNIANYVAYFRQQVESVEGNTAKSPYGDLHRRILYAAVLDALSHSVSTEVHNRKRVVSFVENYCAWPESSRVSLSHLYRLVASKTEPQFLSLKNFAIERISKWIPASKIPIQSDPDVDEVRPVWPQINGSPIPIDGVRLHWLKHSQLWYAYRNSLVHEFRIAGVHVELWDEAEPYYAYLIEYVGEDTRERKRGWELQYTARFFRRLCDTALNTLETYLTEKEIDPFPLISRGNYWITELNAE